jgi:hypothetical protein
MLCATLAMPGMALADSCGTAVTVVNHRSYPVTVTMKSFYMDRELPAPARDDFDTPILTGEVPPHFSSVVDVEVAAGQSIGIPFRRLCTGDFWLNWKVIPATSQAISSGQRRPYYGGPIDIR